MMEVKASARTSQIFNSNQNTWTVDRRNDGGTGTVSLDLEGVGNDIEKPNGSKKNKSKKKKNTIRGISTRDLLHLLCILRVRVVPSVPYLDIIDIIEVEWKEAYIKWTTSEEINTKLYQQANEREKKVLLADWCMKLLEKEYEKCGGRWVAMVNWEVERVVKIIKYLGLDKKGYTLLGPEGISMLRTEITWMKSPKWILYQIKQAEVALNQERRRKLIDIMRLEGQLQRKWIKENDFRACSIPDLGLVGEEAESLRTPVVRLQPPIESPKRFSPSDGIESNRDSHAKSIPVASLLVFLRE